ncbi:MAG: hypothetical protein C0418_03950 [Coriobacteriaceae bacterium]|nr:hypothetical protein [Coriobacteriaceae bacterium]
MVRGLDRFREHFAGLEDRYVLIGGAAVDVAMNAAGLEFRLTKDLDIVLLVESLDAEFGRVFWEFVQDGGYDFRHRSTGVARFYRFHSPSEPSYPAMLELFARRPDALALPPDAELAPLPVADEVSSLSAILLDDAYYDFVRSGARGVDGLTLLGAEHLIPLKANAWLDLTARRERGEAVDSNDIKKHRNDVVRLYQLIAPATRVGLPPTIAEDMRAFLGCALDDGFDPRSVGVRGATVTEIAAVLRAVYGVEA